MNLTAWLAVAAFALSLYGSYDLVHRRVQARRRLLTESDRAVVTSAVELIEPYRVRVRELLEYTTELESKLRNANNQIDHLTREVSELRGQVGVLRDKIED